MHLTYTTLTYKFLYQIFATADDFFLKKSLIHRENELPTMPSHLLNLLLDPHFLIVDAESVYMGYVPRTYMFRWWHTYSLILQSFFVPCASHHLSQLFSLNPSMKNLGW
jgi:hypothetical protein